MRAAVGFLTRLPVGFIQTDDYYRDLGRQAPLFPLVGLLVGGVTAAADWGAGLLFPSGIRAAVAVLAMVWVTGALHLDGLMDTADGIGSHRSRERMLEIMRDSRVGAMGVVAGVLSLLLRFALVSALAPDLRWRALLLAPALGRMAMAAAAGLFPAVRPPGAAMGASFASHVGPWQVAGAVGLGLAAAGLLSLSRGPAAWALALVTAGLVGRALTSKLGGLTGDTYGAINEAAEIAVLGVFAAAWTLSW